MIVIFLDVFSNRLVDFYRLFVTALFINDDYQNILIVFDTKNF